MPTHPYTLINFANFSFLMFVFLSPSSVTNRAGFWSAMASNLTFQSRNVLSKKVMVKKEVIFVSVKMNLFASCDTFVYHYYLVFLYLLKMKVTLVN